MRRSGIISNLKERIFKMKSRTGRSPGYFRENDRFTDAVLFV